MFKTRKSLVWMVAALLLLAAPVFAQDAPTPAVEVSDQAIGDGTVTVARVVSDGPGWITIHADNNGAAGAVLGYTAVVDGENTDVTVEIDMEAATQTMYAMLHTDLGAAGTYEFPGADVPVQVNDQVLSVAFTVTGLGEAQETPTAEVTATTEVTATMAMAGADEPGQLPETGGSSTPWTPVILVGLGLVLLVVGSSAAMRRSADIKIED
jgi:hypothetical protein